MPNHSDDEVLRETLEGSPIGVAILAAETGQRLFVNSRLVEMFGAGSKENLLTSDIKDTWMEPEDFDRAFSVFRRGKVLVNFEAERRRFDLSTWWVLMNTQPVTFESKRAGIVWHIDISDRKRAERLLLQAKQEAEEASRAKSDFLAHVSHELRTPLNSILGFSQVLSAPSTEEIDNTSRIDYARHIHASGQHLLALINDILDISKIEAGEFELDESVFEVGQVISDTHEMLRGFAEQNEISVACRRDDQPKRLLADKRLVTQIVVNLLSNAIKYNCERGRVDISSRLGPKGAVSIAVTDSGIGIAAEDIPKVLAPFGQARSGPHRSHGGTGLGLSLSKQLAEMHGGTLALTSEPGNGTTIEVSFPPERTRPA